MSKKKRTIIIQERVITIQEIEGEDYISLTDMVRGEDGSDHIKNWMRNRNTVEFLGLWEIINNPNFKHTEFDTFKKESGLNSFTLTPQKWTTATAAKGVMSKAGRYDGGTFAHRDIAFEFGTWISPAFKLYLIKEYQRLKESEATDKNLEWNVGRLLSKANYIIHTDAVRKYIIPNSKTLWDKEIEYANEADLLNMVVFGCTAKKWREQNPQSNEFKNIRDCASINELVVLANVESMNAQMIRQNMDKKTRYEKLLEISNYQLEILNHNNSSNSKRTLISSN